jgi:hypothetical protein
VQTQARHRLQTCTTSLVPPAASDIILEPRGHTWRKQCSFCINFGGVLTTHYSWDVVVWMEGLCAAESSLQR